MANFAGLTDPALDVLTITEFAMTAPRMRRVEHVEFASLDALDTPPTMADDHTDGPSVAPDVGGDDFAGIVHDAATPALDWFDKIHILPRETIDFGNIVTLVERPFEIFNAFRSDVDFTLYVNNAGIGIDIPDLPVPVVTIAALSSILDPASTRLNPIQLDVEASADGPPSFDDTLEFTFAPGGIVTLHVTGSRVSLFLPIFNGPVDETLEWNTDVQAVAAGQEQRVSNRRNPRQKFNSSVLVDDDARRRLRSLLFGWHGRTFGVALWHEQLPLSAAVSVGAASASFVSTAGSDLRVGGLCVLYKSDTVFDVLEVLTVTSTTVTFVSTTQNAYAAGDLLMPVRTAKLANESAVRRFIVNAERVHLQFDVIDNDTGAPTGSLGSYATTGGRAILDPTFVDGEESPQSHRQPVTVIDGETGVISHSSQWANSKSSHHVGFLGKTLAEVHAIRRLLIALRGRQVTFVSPTFIEDLIVTQNLVSASTTLVVENVGYTRYVQSREPRATFRIRFNDGTSLIRRILSAVETSATEETLTIDVAWPSARLVSEIRDIQFLQVSRLASDSVRIRHLGVGRARVSAAATVVFDDP